MAKKKDSLSKAFAQAAKGVTKTVADNKSVDKDTRAKAQRDYRRADNIVKSSTKKEDKNYISNAHLRRNANSSQSSSASHIAGATSATRQNQEERKSGSTWNSAESKRRAGQTVKGMAQSYAGSSIRDLPENVKDTAKFVLGNMPGGNAVLTGAKLEKELYNKTIGKKTGTSVQGGLNKITNAGKDLMAKGEENKAAGTANLNKYEKFGVDLAEAVGDIGADMLISKGAGLKKTEKKVAKEAIDKLKGSSLLDKAADKFEDMATRPAMGVMYNRAEGASHQQALDDGATEKQARLYGQTSGMIEVLTEALGGGGSVMAKAFGKGVADDFTELVASKAAKKLSTAGGKSLVYSGTKGTINAINEGIEEALAEIADTEAANLIYNNINGNHQDINWGNVLYSGLLGIGAGGVLSSVGTVADNRSGQKIRNIYGTDGIAELAKKIADADESALGDISTEAKAISQMIRNGEEVANGQLNILASAAQEQQQRNENNFGDSIDAAQKIINDNGYLNPVGMTVQFDENGKPQLVKAFADNTERAYEQSVENGRQAITSVLDENGITMSDEQIQSVSEAIADVQLGLALDSSTIEMFTLSHPAERAALETALEIKLPQTNEGTRSELNKMIATNRVETAKAEDMAVRDQMKGIIHQTETTGYGRNGQMEFASRLGDDQIDAMNGSQVMGYRDTFDDYYRAGLNGYTTLEEIDSYEDPVHMAVPEGIRRAAYTAGIRDRNSAQNLLNNQMVEKGKSITQSLQKANKAGRKASGVVTFAVNNENRKSLGYARTKMWQSVANSLGIDIILADVDNMRRLAKDDRVNSGTNGFYDPKTGTIVTNIDAKRGLDYTLIHEVTHYIRITAPEEYNKLASLVVDRWSRRGGMMNAINQRKNIEGYENLTEEELLEEIIADSTYEFLLDEGFVEEVAKSSPTLAQRLLEAIRYVAKRLRAMIADGNLPDLINEDLFSQLDILKEAETLWLDAYKKAVENSVAADGITRMSQSQLDNEYQKAYEDGDIRYSKSINYESDIDEWVSEGRGNNYPAIVTGSTSNIMQGVGAIEQDIYILPWKINKILEEHPEITIDNIKQIPDVLENPSLILKSSNGYSANNTRVVAFGNVKTATGFMNVVLDFSPVENKTAITDMQKVVSTYTKGDKNLSALRNLIENSEVIYLDNKKATKLLQSIGFTKRPIELLDSGFIGSVSYSKRSVNISGPLFSTLMEDAESKMFDGIRTSQSIDAGYLAAVERGDMDAAQAMVDQAAEERGYATNLYHGTPNKFTVFDPELVSNGKYWGRGIYLTDRMDSAKQFAVDYTTGVVGDTMSLMADLGNSLVIDIESEADKAKVRSMLGKRKNAKLSVDNFRRYINETVWGDWYNAEYGDTTKLGNPKYDSVVVKNSYDRGGGKFDEYIVFNSERIKSADPVTYDNNGNVIPLSQRFNTENNDIRYSQTDSEGNTLTDGQIEYFKGSKVRDENGRLIPMYHGTNSPGFTIFDPLKTDDNRSLFFTSDPMVANTYTYAQNKGHDINPYDMISGESSANDFNRIMESVDGRDRAILLDESMLPEYEDRLNDLLSDENSYQSDIDRYQATVDGIKSHSGEYAEMFIYGDEGIPTLTRNTDDSDFGTESEVVSSLYERVRGFNAPNRYKTYLNLTNPLIIDATRQYAGKHDVYVENDRISGVVDISVDGNLVGSFYSEKEADDFIKNAFTDDADEIISEYKENVVYDSHINVNLNQSGHWRHIAISQDKVVEDLKLEYVDDEHYNLVATMGDGSVKRFDNQTDTELIQAQKSLGLEYPNVNILEGISNILRRRANIDKLKDLYGEELDEHARSYISSYTFGELEEAQPGNINKTRGWSEYAQKNGYDGVIFKNLKDIGAYSGGLVDNASTIAIAFDPNQVKSVQNENPTSGPDIRFSAATEKNDYPKAANPMTGSSVLMENGSAVMISGRKARENAMRDNGFSEVAIKNVNDYFDSMISFIQDDLGIKYRFIGLNDVKNAKVKVRYKNGEPDSIIMSAMLKNGEYPVNFDFSAICKKREGMMQVIKALVNTPTSNGSNVFNSIELTDEQMWKINNALREEGFETACLGCFVEARRYNSHKFYNKIETVWNEKVRKARKKLGLPEEEYFNFADTNKALTEITDKDMQSVEDVWAAYEESTASKKSPNKRIQLLMDTIVKNKDVNSPYLKLISPSDVLTPEGIEGFKTLSTKDHDLVKTIKSFYGTSAPKEILAFTPYNSEIAMLPEKKGDMSIRDYLKSIGGVRTQSFSDFKIENFFDYMQMIADMAARKFTGHAYTKEISFAKIFGKTGMKINLSVMFDIDNEFCKKYGKQYAGLQFIDEADLNTDKYFTDKSIPYSERKGKRYAKAHTLSDGRTGYLVYLVGDKARSDAIFEENYQKNLKTKMTEERARELANMSRPFTQSIDMDEAIELQNRDGYRENVGIIAVAYSDEHMKMLLEDPEIRYIIPYHKSGLPKFVSNKSNMDYALDFTKTQNTNKNAGIKKPNGKKYDTKHELSTIKKNKDIKYPYIELYKRMNDEGVTYAFGKKSTAQKTAMAGTADYDVYEHLSNSKDPKAVVNEYLKYCEDNNYIPIFPEYAGSEGYYKVLFDFSITDGNEVYEQREVTNTYPAANNSVVDITQETGNLDELKSIIDSAAEEQNNLNIERNQKMGKVVDKLLRPDSDYNLLEGTNIQAIKYDEIDYSNPKYTLQGEDEPNNQPRFSKRDAEYMAAAKAGDTEKCQKMVDEAAKNAGYDTPHLYHGTPSFGFTKFDLSKRTNSEGMIYATDDKSVSANYAGRNNYAGVRQIRRKYIENATSVDDVLRNAKTVYGTEYHVPSDNEVTDISNKHREAATIIADKLDETMSQLPESISNNIELNNKFMCYVNIFWTIRDSGYNDYGDTAGYYEALVQDVEWFNDYRDDVKNAFINASDISEKGENSLYKLIVGYELSDAAIDIEYNYLPLFGPQEFVIDDQGKARTVDAIKQATDATHNIGAYNLYGNLGDNPYIVDAKGRMWTNVVADIMPSENGTDNVFGHTTDTIANKARELGHTSVVIENVADGGNRATDYIFFDESQVKSADPITYDDNGEIIPLSERFNAENEDIRFSQNTEDEPLPEDVIYDYMADHPEEFEQMWTSVPEDSNYVQHRAETLESLKTQVQKLKQNQKKTEGKILDESSVRSDFNDMVKAMLQASSEGRGTKKTDNKLVKQVVNNSKIMFNYFHSGDTENMTLTALSAAEDMVDGLKFINDDVYTYYKDLRDYLKTVPVKVDDTIKSDIPDYAEWKKTQWGRIRIANEGIPVDVMYGELCGMFPDMFDSAISNPTDMLLRMGEAMEEVQPYAVYLSSEERAALVSQVASDMIRITMLGKPYQSMVDRYEDKLKAAKQRATEAERDKSKYQRELWKANERTAKADDKLLAQQMAAGREKAALNNQIDAERELRKEKVKAVREDRDAKIKKLQEKQKAKEQARKAARERAKSWKHLQDDYKWLTSRLIKPNDQKHIPEEFRAALAGFLQNLDLQTERSKELELKYGKVSGATQNLINLRTRLGEIAKEDGTGPFVYDGYVFQLMDAMLKKMEGPDEDINALDELTDQTLREVSIILRSIKHGIDNVDKARTEGQKKKISELGESTIDSCNAHVRVHGKYKVRQNFLSVPDQILNESMVTPRDMFNRIGGGLNETFMGIRHGFDKHVDNIDYARKFFAEIFNPYKKTGVVLTNREAPGSEIEKWRGTKSVQEFTLVNGEKISMSTAQIMSLYCSIKREQAAGHIYGGGIVVTEVTDNSLKTVVFGKPKEIQTGTAKITPIDAQSIVSKLTQEQKDMANKLLSFLNNECAEWGNETSMALYGYRKFTEPNYFPIKSSDQYLDSSFDAHDSVEKIRNFGFTKGTVVNANNPVVIDDIFSVVANHINQMSMYNAFAAPIADFTRVYNYRTEDEDGIKTISAKESIRAAWGDGVQKYISNFIEDLQNQQKLRRDPVDTMVNKLLANYKKATIGFNLRVALQQPTAIIRSFAMINPKYFANGNINVKANLADMKAHCQISKWKSWGFNQIDLANTLEDIMMNKEWSREDILTMKIYGALDDVTWSAIWAAVKNETKVKHPEVAYESEEFYAICNERASEIFDKTQVVDSPLHRSQIMRKKDLMSKMLVSFMAEPTRTYNMMRSAYAEAYTLWKSGDIKGARKIMATYTSVYVVNAFVCGAAAALADALRHAGDDDDEGWWGYTLSNFWSNIKPWNMLPLFKELESYWNGWGTSNMAFEGVEALVKATSKIAQGDFSPKAFGDLLNAVGLVTGKPIKNVRRELKSLFGVEVFAATTSIVENDATTSEDENGLVSAIKSWLGKNSDNETGADKTEASGNGDDSENFDRAITTDDIDYGMYSYLYEDNSDGSIVNKAMNWFNIGDDTAREYKVDDKAFNEAVAKAQAAGEGKVGEEHYKAINSAATKNYSQMFEAGDIETVKEMRRVVEAAGGDLDKFDENAVAAAKKALKKNLGEYGNSTARVQLTSYLRVHGVSDSEIAEYVAGSDTAKELSKAMGENDEAKVRDLTIQLYQAGLNDEQYTKLYENRWKYVEAETTGEFDWPATGRVSSEYGQRWGTLHAGIDIAMPVGTEVGASDGGEVIKTGYNGSLGNYVDIRHANGYITRYQHLDSYCVVKGQKVSKNETIAKSGNTGNSTGAHLHFSVYQGKYEKDTTHANSIDPRQFLEKKS